MVVAVIGFIVMVSVGYLLFKLCGRGNPNGEI